MPRRRLLTTVAHTGDRIETLRNLRDLLAREIESCDSKRDLAALTHQFVNVLAAIDAAGGEQTMEDRVFDELAMRRSDRGADPGGGVDSVSG
jgi:hypothetical protein